MNWKIILCMTAFLFTQDAYADRFSGAADCEAYARNAERHQSSVVGGAANSAVKGAILGRILGGDSKSRRRGAKLGAISGGIKAAKKKKKAYDRAYRDCMQNSSN